jgi:hypothetical protein
MVTVVQPRVKPHDRSCFFFLSSICELDGSHPDNKIQPLPFPQSPRVWRLCAATVRGEAIEACSNLAVSMSGLPDQELLILLFISEVACLGR